MMYGVSFGDGNDGVSHTFPNYCVKTDDPWILTAAACFGEMGPEIWEYVSENLEIDGEENYCISGVIYNPEESPDWSEANGAWFICNVFPVEETEKFNCPVYDSVDKCFGEDEIKWAKEMVE